jgi:hypothetical protein
MCIQTVSSNQHNNAFSSSTSQNGAGCGTQGRNHRESSQSFAASQSSSFQGMNQSQSSAGNGAYSSSSQQSFSASQRSSQQGFNSGQSGGGQNGDGNSSQESSQQSAGSCSLCKGVLSAIGSLAQGAHWAAENLIKASGLGPVFQTFDKPIVHSLWWSPIARMTGTPVDSHPPGVD